MAILSKFGTQTIKINIADNIQNGVAGVMGDFNSRALKVSIMAENGEVLEDPSIKIKLLCKTEKEELIFTEGEYLGEGIFQVNFANEVFEQEQELECIIQLSKEDEILYSRIFKRRVERGLLGTEREGTSTIIDLLKIMDFADNYEEKLKEMEALGNKEEADIIRKAKAETDKFNRNAKVKTDAVNKIKTEVEGYKDITVKAKDTTLENKADFDKNYNRVTGILDAETDRERAEEERRKHDKEIQDLINGGLDNAGFVKLEDLKETETNLKTNLVGENILINSKKLEADGWSGILNTNGNILLGELPLSDVYTRYGISNVRNYMLTFSCDLQIVEQTISGDWKYCLMGFANLNQDNQRIYFQEFKSLGKLGGKSYTKLIINIPLSFKNPYDEKIKLIGFFTNRDGEQIQYKIKNIKLEVGEKATPYKPNFNIKLEKLENDLIEQNEENAKRFNKVDNANTFIQDRIKVLETQGNITVNATKTIERKLNEILAKIEDSNRNYRNLLENDKDLIGGV